MRDILRFVFTNAWREPRIGWVLVGLFAALMAVIVPPAYWAAKTSCERSGAVMQVEDVTFDFWAGCFFYDDGRWVASDRFRLDVEVDT